ncbi:MAG: tRNA preQ1(34) S-adenosylmethionine ribosyltransferase-isomerase QueA [Alkalispirochaeta sp.]
MKTSDFFFELPPELIAQEPIQDRGTSRLLVLDRETGAHHHRTVADIRDFVPPGSVMVFNNSRVRKARVYARRVDTDREQEFLLVQRREANRWLAIGRNSRKLKEGARFRFLDGTTGEIYSVEDPYRELRFDRDIDDTWLETHGHIPLPPYITRGDTAADAERYQTVYAKTMGSIAAPTAGLHFTPELLEDLRAHGVTVSFVTLHVGIGTFLPVRTEEIEDHEMHEEEYHVSPETALEIAAAREGGHPVVAVGTTSVRTLESAWDATNQEVRSGHGRTNLFIYPGYTFRAVDQMFTNFHTPESTLLAMVSAFAGRERIIAAYQEAVARRYRFFSYGDAMLIR